MSLNPSTPITVPAARSIQRFQRSDAAAGAGEDNASATIEYQPASMQKIKTGSTSIAHRGTSFGSSDTNPVAYTTAVLGLLTCVARPSQNERRELLPIVSRSIG